MDSREEAKFWDEQQQNDAFNELEGKYNRLVSKLMTLQGQREVDEITDSQSRSKFQGLQQAIKTWVNKVRQDLLRSGQQDVVRQAVEDQHGPALSILMYFLSVNRETAQTDSASPTFTPDDIAWAQWLGSHPTAIHVVLSLGVWSGLQKYILRRSFPIGIDKHSERMFKEVMKTMDQELGQRWMSQTMTALAKTDIFKEGRATKMKSISDKLWSELKLWPLMHIPDETTHYQNLKGLVECAVDLHEDLRCSRDIFEMVNPRNLVRGKLPDDVSHWDLMNLTQWLLLSGKEDSEGALLCLYPGLDRHVANDNATVSISKPTVIVYDTYDLWSFQRSSLTQSRPDSISETSILINYPSSCRRNSTWRGQESQPHALPPSSPTEDDGPLRRPRAGSSPNLGSSALKGPGTAAEGSRAISQDTKRSSKAGTRWKGWGRRDKKRSPDEVSSGSKQKTTAKQEKRKEGSSKGKSASDKIRGHGAVTTESRSATGSKTPPSEGTGGPIDQNHSSVRDPGQKSPAVVLVKKENAEEEDEESSSQEDDGDSDSQSNMESEESSN